VKCEFKNRVIFVRMAKTALFKDFSHFHASKNLPFCRKLFFETFFIFSYELMRCSAIVSPIDANMWLSEGAKSGE
jgi:hypothetical protein